MISRRLNVTFEDGKTIIDGIPSILYFSAMNHGVGQLYLGDEPVTGLIEVGINAKSNNYKIYPIELRLQLAVKRFEQEGDKNDLHGNADGVDKNADGV
jgi:hypothetical protein